MTSTIQNSRVNLPIKTAGARPIWVTGTVHLFHSFLGDPYIYKLGGGGFKHFLFSPRNMGK